MYILQNLVDPDITYRHRAISEKIQWNAVGIAFMLNTDVALYIDIQVFNLAYSSSLPFYMFPPSFSHSHFLSPSYIQISIRLMLMGKAHATSPPASPLLLQLLLRHSLQAMRCFLKIKAFPLYTVSSFVVFCHNLVFHNFLPTMR